MPITESRSRMDYDFITDQLDDQYARVRFAGTFLGNKVIWHATIMTLHHYYREYVNPGEARNELRQFIEIGPGSEREQYELTVALGTACIDHPTILKTIIMIRNYKRLAMGRHEFGNTYRMRRQ